MNDETRKTIKALLSAVNCNYARLWAGDLEDAHDAIVMSPATIKDGPDEEEANYSGIEKELKALEDLIKISFKDFQKTRVEMTPKEYANAHGTFEGEHDKTRVVHCYHGYYINEREDGRFNVEYYEGYWVCDSLIEAEVIFWGEFLKNEIN